MSRPLALVISDGPVWERLLSGSSGVREYVGLWRLKLTCSVELGEVARWISENAPNLCELTLSFATDSSAHWGGIQLRRLTSLVANVSTEAPNGAGFAPRFLQIATGLVHLELEFPSENGHLRIPDGLYEAIAALPSLRSLALYGAYGRRPIPVCFADRLTRLETVSLALYPADGEIGGPGWCSAAGLFRRGRVYPRLTSLKLILGTVSDSEATRDALGRVWPQDMFPRLQKFKIGLEPELEVVAPGLLGCVREASIRARFNITEYGGGHLAARRA